MRVRRVGTLLAAAFISFSSLTSWAKSLEAEFQAALGSELGYTKKGQAEPYLFSTELLVKKDFYGFLGGGFRAKGFLSNNLNLGGGYRIWEDYLRGDLSLFFVRKEEGVAPGYRVRLNGNIPEARWWLEYSQTKELREGKGGAKINLSDYFFINGEGRLSKEGKDLGLGIGLLVKGGSLVLRAGPTIGYKEDNYGRGINFGLGMEIVSWIGKGEKEEKECKWEKEERGEKEQEKRKKEKEEKGAGEKAGQEKEIKNLEEIIKGRGQPEKIKEIVANYGRIIEEASLRYKVEKPLIIGIIGVESGGKAEAISRCGAVGLMQLMPQTARKFGLKKVYGESDECDKQYANTLRKRLERGELNFDERFDPEKNILAGTAYMRFLSEKYNGDLEKVLSAYLGVYQEKYISQVLVYKKAAEELVKSLD